MNNNTRLLVMLAVLSTVALQGCGGAENRWARAMQRGQEYLHQENYPKARVEFGNALQIHPNDADARYYAALVAEKLGDLRTAVQGYQSALNVDATHARSLAALGRIYVFSGLAEQGLEKVGDGLEAHPGDPDLLAVRAAAELALGDEDAAFEDAQAAVAADPDNERGIALLAGMYRSRQQAERALELVSGALERNPGSVDLRTVLAQIKLDGGDLEGAEAELERIVEQRPDDLAERQRLVRFYVSTGQLDAAERSLRELIALDPDSAEYKMALVSFLAANRSFDAAEAELSERMQAGPEDDALRLAAGRFYESHSLPDDAERLYEAVMERSGTRPAGLSARDRLAALRLRAGRVAEAEPLIEEVLRENPRDNEALVLRASLELARSRPVEAITDLRAVLRDQPDSVPVLRTLARAHAQNNEPDLARDNYRHAIEVDPANRDVRIEFADWSSKRGEMDESLRLLDAVLATDPQDIEALDIEFRVLAAKNENERAAEVAEKTVEAHPEAPLGYYMRGVLAESDGRLEDALSSYRLALDKAPRGAEPLGAATRVLVRLDRKAEARRLLEDTVGRQPDNAVALNLLAELQLGARELEGAAETAGRAASMSPGWWLPYRTKALALLAAGKKSEAEAAYLDGMKAARDAPGLGMELAALYERDGRPDDAIAVYERLRASNPGSEPVANNLAMLLVTYRDDGVSRQQAQELVRGFRNSDNPAYLNTYGWVRYRQGQLDEAVSYLRRASSAAPDNPAMHYHLGMALLDRGDAELARAELEKALQSDQPFPGKDEARRALGSLPRSQG